MRWNGIRKEQKSDPKITLFLSNFQLYKQNVITTFDGWNHKSSSSFLGADERKFFFLKQEIQILIRCSEDPFSVLSRRVKGYCTDFILFCDFIRGFLTASRLRKLVSRNKILTVVTETDINRDLLTTVRITNAVRRLFHLLRIKINLPSLERQISASRSIGDPDYYHCIVQ